MLVSLVALLGMDSGDCGVWIGSRSSWKKNRKIYMVNLILRRHYINLNIFVLFQFPSRPENWIEISRDFEELWDFPFCMGAMDGKHVAISEPPNSGAHCFNYKGFYSIVLFGIANAKYEFIYVHVGTNGRVSDVGILQETDFYDMLENETLNLPDRQRLIDVDVPYVFLGDSAFQLSKHIMKPYPYSTTNWDERIFNYRLSRARRVIENTFGILSAKFRVLLTTISLTKFKNIDGVILACCTLHNYLKEPVITTSQQGMLTMKMKIII